ncbi:hypothetical protein GBA52_000979 [Prunus armeniaca]|nr:hypothetical protein GBA52_000979 [Prunus armeniaca]
MTAEEEMKKNPGKEVVAVGNKKTCVQPKTSNFASVFPAKRRSVKKMMFDSMVQSMASLFHSLSNSNSNSKSTIEATTKNSNIIFPHPNSNS